MSSAPTGSPFQKFQLRPGHPRFKCQFTFQYFQRGHWHASNYTWSLNSRSTLYNYTHYKDRAVIGIPHRVRAVFPGDGSHGRAESRWMYWKVTG